MTGFTPFDILSVPLRGTRLIEASAGTGKTFTITHLILRLIAEARLDISRILAVTFTEAATMELRERIRRTLNQARSLVDAPDMSDNSVAAAVVRQAVQLNDSTTVAKALKKAILSFDDAGVFTIHGFCNRILHQFAFESSLRFDMELVTDQSRFVQEVADDFWRRTFGRAPRIICAVAMAKGLSARDLAGFSRVLTDKPALELVPAAGETDPAPALIQIFDDARRLWQRERDAIMEMLRADNRLSRNQRAFKLETLERYAADLERVFDGSVDPAGLTAIHCFSTDFIWNSVKPSMADKGMPEHPFFDLCQRFVLTENALAVHYRHAFRHFLEQELSRRKQDSNVRYFSDLLSGLHRALSADRHNLLASAVRNQYQAVLIDEFQDTDPIQYDIFDRLFGVDTHALFLIGDPKQSIFAFRSADIFSYIHAANDIPLARKYALPWNWRSETGLVEAVNHLFSQAENPFVLGDGIDFTPVAAAPDNTGNRLPLRIDAHEAGRVKLWFIGADEQGRLGKLNKEPAREVVMDAVADEISSLLNRSAAGRVLVGDRPLGPADIAVLITRNRDAGRIKDRLTKMNIPAVISRTGSVFLSAEARSMERLLMAMAAPTDYRRVNTALADDLIGCSAKDIQAFVENNQKQDQYEYHLRNFSEYHELWQSSGFIRGFRRFMSDYQVRLRLLGFPDGERRLTNVLHLSELIHRTAVQNRLGMNGLLDWIAEKREAEEEAPDDEQLRLERDDDAVQIVTIWKSKGLQYPVVFCPFLWDKAAAVGTGDVFFHEGRKLKLDIGTDDINHARAAEREKLSELVRLLYVAVTRAVNRCYLVYGKIGDPGRSGITALDYVMTGGLPEKGLLDELKKRKKELDAEGLFDLARQKLGPASAFVHLERYRRRASAPCSLAKDTGQGILRRKHFPHDQIDQEWGIASFTHLTVHGRSSFHPPEDNRVKRDEFTVFDFPAGAVPGLCVHSIFEQLDFSLSSPEETRALIASALNRYGLDDSSSAGHRWRDILFRMVEDVLRAPVLPHDSGFALGRLSADRMIPEMEFYYPVRRLTADTIRSVLGRPSIENDESYESLTTGSERLEFKPIHGYMRGFIDLVFEHQGRFYVLDWKTNHLGYDFQDYAFPRLRRCMTEASYYLQYYIYTVALHRYLGARLPDYDYDDRFGGVIYLFVRGVSPDIPGNGVYYDRPDKTAVMAFDRALG